MKKIRTCFIFDFMGDLEEEVEGAIMELDTICGYVGDKHLPISIVTKSTALNSEIMKTSYDLMVIDYGGLSAGSSTGRMQVDAACRYAENHPGCLVVIWTGYTSYIYEDELEEKFGHLDNITKRYDGDNAYENLDGKPAFLKKFRNWFGIKEK